MIVPTSYARLRAEAVTLRRRLIDRLHIHGTPEAVALADALDACSPTLPCNSGACPVCGGDFQLVVVELVDREIKVAARTIRGRMHLGTIVPIIGCVEPDALTVDVCCQVRAAVTEALIACGIPPCLVAIDISFNEDATGVTPPHWCVHVHWIGLNWLSKVQVDALKQRFPSSSLVKKPVDHATLDTNPSARFYAYKPQRVRRVSHIASAKADGSRGAYRDTKRYKLRPSQSVTLALVEHELGYRGRLINHGISRNAVKAVVDAFEWARDGP